jgi:hypothetical protein
MNDGLHWPSALQMPIRRVDGRTTDKVIGEVVVVLSRTTAWSAGQARNLRAIAEEALARTK